MDAQEIQTSEQRSLQAWRRWMPSLLQSRYSTYVTRVGKKSGPLTTTLSTMEEVDAFLAPVKVQYLYVTWVGKKSGPLTTILSNMEEVDAFLAPVKVLCM
jgi:hypothetical protein